VIRTWTEAGVARDTAGQRLMSAVPPASPLALAGCGLAAAAALLGLISGRLVDDARVDGYGILFALPVWYWMAVAIGAVATGILIRAAATERSWFAAPVVALWLLIAHTAPALAHEHARFSIVYIHLGFVRLIDATGTGNVFLDARFAWPGFFSAFVPTVSGIDPAVLDGLMRLWPTLIIAATAALVAALARRAYPNLPLIGPLSSVVYVLLAWTGQDYFSPQSIGFLFYLSAMVVVESGPLRPRGAWSTVAPVLSRFATAGGDRPEARSVTSAAVLVLLMAATVVTHPLAPFFLCGALAVLGLYGRAIAWRLLALVTVGYVIWVVIVAEPWWSTRISELAGQFGSFFSNFQSSTSERVAQSSPPHYFVTRVRTAVGLLTFSSTLVLGSVMATDRFRHLRPTLPLAPLAGIPVVAAGLQSYGGEIIIRVLLFTLPMASILLARILLALPRPTLPVAVPVLTTALIPLFLLARFGNEAFEMTTAADWDATQVLYQHVDDGTVVVADNSFSPWGDRDRQRTPHLYSDAQPTGEWLDELRADAAEARAERILVIFTPSQSAWREQVESAPPGSLDQIGRWLANQPSVTVLHQADGAWVFSLPA
jgi:hypothetical protein